MQLVQTCQSVDTSTILDEQTLKICRLGPLPHSPVVNSEGIR